MLRTTGFTLRLHDWPGRRRLLNIALPSDIRALLLDLGNVIVEIDFHRAFIHWADAAEADPAVLAARFHQDQNYALHETGRLEFARYANMLEQQLGIELPLAEWQAGWNALFVGPFDEVVMELARLRGQIPISAFSNTNATHYRYWRRRYRQALTSLDQIYVSCELGLRKPDPEAFARVAEKMGVAPHQVLFLDDLQENVDGASSAGMSAVRVDDEAAVVAILRELNGRRGL